MKKHNLFLFENVWMEVLFGITVLIAFALIGYLSREFAVDLQTYFLGGDWGSF